MKGSTPLGILVTIVSLGTALFFIFEGLSGRNIGPLLAVAGGVIMLLEQAMDLTHSH